MATSQQFAAEMNEFEGQVEEIAAEDPPFDLIYMTEKKIKYINDKYKRVGATMYDPDCDVKLKVGNSFFKAHRRVLSEASDYFAAMFSTEMKEKDEFNIELKELSPAGFSAMLDYFYHGHVTVEDKVVPDVLEAGRFFHVKWILDICCDYMIRHLSMYDYDLTLDLADQFSLGDLEWHIFHYFSPNLPSLLQKETFYKDMCYEFLYQFLKKGVHVDVSEFSLMQMVLKWTDVAEESLRKDQLLPLLKQIRFPIMDMEELEDIPQEVLDIEEIKTEIEAAKCYCLDIAGQSLIKVDEEKYLSRGARPTVVLSSFMEEENVVMYKDPHDDHANLFREELGPSGLFVEYSSTNQAVIGNFLYAAGGYDDECKSSKLMFRFDPRDREWMQLARMSQPRVSFSMCSSINKLYVLGGVYHIAGDIGEEIILASVEMYDPKENVWISLPSLPLGIFDSASAYCRDKLYISGGIANDSSFSIPLKTVYSLREGQAEWSPLPDMICPRQGHSMSAINDKLYVLGGYTSREEETGFKNCYRNEMFDVETQQWTEIISTPEEYGHLYRHVGVLDSKIFFLCTEDSEVFIASFDTEKDQYNERVNIGSGICRVSVLSVGYPYQ